MQNEVTWVRVAGFASGLEAEMTVAVLEAAGIPAVARGNDIVGIFGPGFQGPTAHGVDVLVPSSLVEQARTVIAGGEEEGDGAYHDPYEDPYDDDAPDTEEEDDFA